MRPGRRFLVFFLLVPVPGHETDQMHPLRRQSVEHPRRFLHRLRVDGILLGNATLPGARQILFFLFLLFDFQGPLGPVRLPLPSLHPPPTPIRQRRRHRGHVLPGRASHRGGVRRGQEARAETAQGGESGRQRAGLGRFDRAHSGGERGTLGRGQAAAERGSRRQRPGQGRHHGLDGGVHHGPRQGGGAAPERGSRGGRPGRFGRHGAVAGQRGGTHGRAEGAAEAACRSQQRQER
mmetsp:Transcript_15551/g.31812  ORF Transcript_15551/g.31812 Transcript_15551/m.31812 type:complete len:236 (+) Transcript_15551:478-1185(+)